MGIVTNYKEPDQLEDSSALYKFNWGAFYFDWVWGLANGALGKTIWIILIQVLIIIPVIMAISAIGMVFISHDFSQLTGSFIFLAVILVLLFGAKIYFGIKGNNWAYKGRAFYNLEDFSETQKRWAIAALSLFLYGVLNLVIAFALYAIAMATLASMGLGGGAFGSSSQAKTIIQDIIDGEKANGRFASGPAAVDYLIENSSFVKSNEFMYNTSKYSPNSFQMTMKDSPDMIFYLFLVKKTDNCSLSQKNCYVTRYNPHTKGTRPTVAEKLYFDNNGKTQAAKK